MTYCFIKDIKKVFLFVLILISFPLHADDFLCDGIWEPTWKKLFDIDSPWNFKNCNYSWGKAKELRESLRIDLNQCIFTNNDIYVGYSIEKVEKIDNHLERIVLSHEIPVDYLQGRDYVSFILNFQSNESMYLYKEKEGADLGEIPSGAFKYIRISGPARISIKNAVLNDTRVRCRTEPNLNCETWGYLNAGDKVLIKDISYDPFEIDGESWYWYKVESDALPDGWVYGKYLDIEE